MFTKHNKIYLAPLLLLIGVIVLTGFTAWCGPDTGNLTLKDNKEVADRIKHGTVEQRRELLSEPTTWRLLAFTRWQLVVFELTLVVPPLLMSLGYAHLRSALLRAREATPGAPLVGASVGETDPAVAAVSSPTKPEQHEPWSTEVLPDVGVAPPSKHANAYVGYKRWGFLTLLTRDIASLSFDVSMHQDRAEITEYRGLIHWFRDVCEKLLALVLIVSFAYFLTRFLSHLIYMMSGEGWYLTLLPVDVNVAITIVGFALIVDGFVIVSTMTDAPGIGRTLDAVIVILAGYVVMLVEAEPGLHALVAFRLGPTPWLAPVLAVVIGFLFVVRWIVRHHTIHEWRGERA
jgi:hypothetical protein